jgi:hypothetical protein
MVSFETEHYDGPQLTTVDELLRNLIEVYRVRDARISYLASAAMERLTTLASAAAERLAALKSTAASRGFVHLNLLNRPWSDDPELALLNRNFMERFEELVDALRSYRPIWGLDRRVAQASEKVQEAYESLKQVSPS